MFLRDDIVLEGSVFGWQPEAAQASNADGWPLRLVVTLSQRGVAFFAVCGMARCVPFAAQALPPARGLMAVHAARPALSGIRAAGHAVCSMPGRPPIGGQEAMAFHLVFLAASGQDGIGWPMGSRDNVSVPAHKGQFDGGEIGVSRVTGSQPTGGTDQSGGTIRRVFLRIAMAGGLAAGYGTLAAMAGRFLYSSPGVPRRWQFVGTLDRWPVGHSINYVAPNGGKILVTRQHEGESEEAFTALSSICPHLGCQVHWEPQNKRFFCPCHNGVFDRQGVAVSGPPAAARQVLTGFPLKVDRGRLFILAPVSLVTDTAGTPARQTSVDDRASFFVRCGRPVGQEA